jgi:hypothetical protein
VCIERVGVYEPGRERDAGKGNDAGGKRDVNRGDAGRRRDMGRGDTGRSSALRVPHFSAVRTQVLVVAECASGFAHLPNCFPAPYGSSSSVRL